MTNERRFDLLHPECSVDTSVEHKTWHFLSTRIKLLLAAYPTSIEVLSPAVFSHVSHVI